LNISSSINKNLSQIFQKDQDNTKGINIRVSDTIKTYKENESYNHNLTTQDNIQRSPYRDGSNLYMQNSNINAMGIFDQYPPSKINLMMDTIEMCSLNDFDKLPNTYIDNLIKLSSTIMSKVKKSKYYLNK